MFVLLDTIGSAYERCGMDFRTTPAHPPFMRSFDRSEKWKLMSAPNFVNTAKLQPLAKKLSKGRPCAVFRYSGEPMDDADKAFELTGLKRKAVVA